MANAWQGNFPHENLKLDGYERTSPITVFPPNSYGLYDMIGNAHGRGIVPPSGSALTRSA